jgi:hypothetical protein
MERIKLNDWEKAVDSEPSSLVQDLPTEYPIGGDYYEEIPNQAARHWKRLDAIAGKAGARWAYWSPWKESASRYGIGPNPDLEIVADTIFNGDSANFIGMLGIPFNGIKGPVWVLLSPRMTPPPEQKIYEEKPRERYERSRETYNPDTGETRYLPGHPKYTPPRDGVG